MNVENSKLRPYFQQNKPFPSGNEDDNLKLRALAEAKLDFFDSFYTQQSHIPWSRHTMEGWKKYFEQSFKCSVVLRETFCLDENMYGNHLREFVRQTFAPTGLCKNGQAMEYTAKEVNCHE